MIGVGKAAERYTQLEQERRPFLDRAREAAKLTVPHLMPEEGHDKESQLYQPYQSLGSRGVRNLASKLLLSTLPPNTPFFKYAIDELLLEEMTQQQGLRGEVDKALSARERAVMNEVEKAQFRPTAFEVLRQLIVAGSVLLNVPKKGNARYFRLDSYVTKRDPKGNTLEIVVEERFAYNSLPEDIRAIVQAAGENPSKEGEEKTIKVYTHIKLREGGKMFDEYQEVVGTEIPGTRGSYPVDKTPWLSLRMTRIAGEDYGRSYVEEFIGDLTSLEGLSQAIVEGSAAAAKMLILVNPNGTTRAEVISKARNLDVVSGKEEDISVMRVEKNADFAVAKTQADEISQRLSYAFLMNTAIQRNGERVTAEEIRYMAQELDDALGGVYSLLSTEFQLPLVPLFEKRMESVRNLPELPKEAATPTVVTGIDALGRGQDLRNLDAFIAGPLEILGPEEVLKRVNAGEYFKRRAAALGIETEGLIISDEQLAQNEQMQQLMQMLQQLGPNAINQLGQMIQNGQKAGLEQPQEQPPNG